MARCPHHSMTSCRRLCWLPRLHQSISTCHRSESKLSGLVQERSQISQAFAFQLVTVTVQDCTTRQQKATRKENNGQRSKVKASKHVSLLFRPHSVRASHLHTHTHTKLIGDQSREVWCIPPWRGSNGKCIWGHQRTSTLDNHSAN